MNIVTTENLVLTFASQEILRGEGFAIQQGEKVGLIGANGTGKSTLLRVLYGTQKPDDGQVHYAKSVTTGYLPQDILEMPQGRLLSIVLNSAPGIKDIEARLWEVEQALGQATEPKEQADLAERLADLHERKDLFSERYSKSEAEAILLGLGFKTTDFTRDLSEFSGGWKMRAALAGLLFRKPDLMLMDEPTNHLDVPSVAWFDEFINQSKCAMLLVTHDREFIDSHVERILSFEFEGLRSYTGNYTQYLKLRQDEEELLLAHAKNIEDRKRQASRFISRFRAKNTKAKQVQSRIKELEKLKEIDLPRERKKLRFTFPPTARGGKDVIKVEKLCKSFPSVTLFENLDLTVYRGDRIGIVGVNGAGKTTLLRMMAQEVAPDAGAASLGHNVELSYYAQHHSEELNLNRTVLDEVWSVVPNDTLTYVRTVCGSFLFSGDDVEKYTGVLSGGEKARVALAKILVKPGNLLLMDEPTNHLDLWSAEALGEALESYDGTLVFVSHNRAFVNRLAQKIWDIRQGEVYEYPGNLDDYLYHRKLIRQKREEQAAQVAGQAALSVSSEPPRERSREAKKAQKRAEAEARQEAHRRLNPLKEKVAKLEEEIAFLEERYSALQERLADPKIYEEKETSVPLLTEFEKVKQRLDRQMFEWEEANEKMQQIIQEMGLEEDS